VSVRSEVIALLDAVGDLGGRNYADAAPEGLDLPYTVMIDWQAVTIGMQGDAQTSWWRNQMQVDLWEERSSDSDHLRNEVRDALDGKRLVAGLRTRVRSAIRVPDPNYDLVHTAFTVSVTEPG
jgi:hypothetical protein